MPKHNNAKCSTCNQKLAPLEAAVETNRCAACIQTHGNKAARAELTSAIRKQSLKEEKTQKKMKAAAKKVAANRDRKLAWLKELTVAKRSPPPRPATDPSKWSNHEQLFLNSFPIKEFETDKDCDRAPVPEGVRRHYSVHPDFKHGQEIDYLMSNMQESLLENNAIDVLDVNEDCTKLVLRCPVVSHYETIEVPVTFARYADDPKMISGFEDDDESASEPDEDFNYRLIVDIPEKYGVDPAKRDFEKDQAWKKMMGIRKDDDDDEDE